MWIQNKFLRTFAGVSVLALLAYAFSPPKSVADGSNDKAPRSADSTQPTRSALAPAPLPPTRAALPAAQYHPPATHPTVRLAAGTVRGTAYENTAPSVALTPGINQRPLTMPSLPEGDWTNETPLGTVQMSVSGNKITIEVNGAGELAMFNPSLRGEFSTASDGTIYGMIHSVDMGIAAAAMEDLGEEFMLLSGLSDIPFSMRAYSEPEVLAIKQVTIGMPMQLMMATDGECSELSIYAQSMLAGHYEKR